MSIFEKCEKNRKNRKTKILRKEKTLRYKNLTLQKGVFLGKDAKNSVNTTKNISFVNIEKVGCIGC